MEFNNNDMYYQNIINDTDEDNDYKYIYKVVINKNKKLFFIEENETHPYFNLNNTKIYYVKVKSSDKEYQQAFYNYKTYNLSKY